MLAARYDVSSLTSVELLRWDYKEGVRDGVGALGIAAICETTSELVARSGGVAGLQADMAEAAEARGGLGLLLALTKEASVNHPYHP